MRFRFDHVVIVVPSLDEGIDRYRAAGFCVLRGGRHDILPTESALIPFADGSYLELIAMRESHARAEVRELAAGPRWEAHLHGLSAIGRRFLPRLAGSDGVGDYALGGAQLSRFASEARRRSLVMTGPARFGRETPEGRRLEMDLLLPAADHLPFFIEDHTPREWRVPTAEAATTHDNRARGIAAVMVRVTDVPAAALELASLFDAPPRVGGDGGARVRVAGVDLQLEPGESAGACGVMVSGVRRLPADVEADGIRGTDDPESSPR